MRVLHVTDTYLPRRGGIELHVHDLAQAQRLAGDEVDVLTLTRARGAEPAPSSGLLRPADDAGLVTKLRFVLAHRRHGRTGAYDVVHAHCSTFSPLVLATIAAADGLPTAVTAHSLWRRYTPLYRAVDYAGGWSSAPVAWSAVSNAAADTVRRAAARPVRV